MDAHSHAAGKAARRRCGSSSEDASIQQLSCRSRPRVVHLQRVSTFLEYRLAQRYFFFVLAAQPAPLISAFSQWLAAQYDSYVFDAPNFLLSRAHKLVCMRCGAAPAPAGQLWPQNRFLRGWRRASIAHCSVLQRAASSQGMVTCSTSTSPNFRASGVRDLNFL